MSTAAAIHTVVYARDAVAVAEFYEQVLQLVRVEATPRFILLAGNGHELSVVTIPAEFAEQAEPNGPRTPREATPIKVSFLVADIESRREAVFAAGGSLKPAESGWSWRGQMHVDGIDPEGNVFQLRQLSE